MDQTRKAQDRPRKTKVRRGTIWNRFIKKIILRAWNSKRKYKNRKKIKYAIKEVANRSHVGTKNFNVKKDWK